MDTQRTVREIEEAIVEHEGGWRKNICVPNVTAGSFLLDHEADLIVVNPSGYAHEFEIKRSFEDFKRDFSKTYGHRAECIYRFSYVVPQSISDKVLDFLNRELIPSDGIISWSEKMHRLPHVLAYDEDLNLVWLGGFSELDPNVRDRQKRTHRSMHLEEMLKLARLGTMRYWNLRTYKDE